MWFGHYPQGPKNPLEGTGYENEKIKWRVLSVNGDEALLLADQNLDVERYNETLTDVTWETSTVRSWLNGYGSGSNKDGKDYSSDNFMDKAFTSGEQAAIKEKTIQNPDNPEYGTAGGNPTTDKIFFLSIDEVTKPVYGFPSDPDEYTKTKGALNTDYAKSQGAYTNTSTEYAGNSKWWLRLPGGDSSRAAYVSSGGRIDYHGDSASFVYYDGQVNRKCRIAVRPALFLNLKSNLWSYAGTVSSEGKVEETGGGQGDQDGSANNGVTEVDPSKISVSVRDYDALFDSLEGAEVEVEGIGKAATNKNGSALIANSLTQPSAMKKITAKKEGYRDYIFYSTIVSPEVVSLFKTNCFDVSLKKKKAGDDANPYVSTIVYYEDGVAKTCGGQRFERSDNVTFRACGVWNGKKPGHYRLWQEGQGGKSLESEDGIFRVNIGNDFSGKGKIYVSMVAQDGAESEAEWVYVSVPEGDGTSGDDSYVPILNESSESGWQTNVPFLHNDKLSFDLGKLKTTIKRKGSKVRIMLGGEKEGDVFKDEEWESWKKFCESQPVDLSLSQWKNVLSSDNLETSWTAGAKIKATGYGWLENDMSPDSETPMTGGIQVIIDMSTNFKQQYAVGVVPVYMEQSLGVNGELEGSVTYDTGSRKFGGDHKLTVTPALSVGGGVGVLYVATVGAEGTASMPMTLVFPKGLTQADLKGALSLKVSVLGFNYSKEMANATYPLYKKEAAKTAKLKGAAAKALSASKKQDVDAASLYDMDRYALPDEPAAKTKWHGNQGSGSRTVAKAKAVNQKSNLTEKLLQSGTSELTEPMLVQEGNTTLAVFLTEDGSRKTIHRTKLVYTVYDKASGTWSDPAAVEEDGTGDFQPCLTASNGKVAVAWLNYAGKITDASSMKEALRTSEIRCALWNEKTRRFTKTSQALSSSSSVSYNSAHPWVDENGSVTLVGLKNTGTDIFGASGDNALFMTGTYDRAQINKEFNVSQGIPVSYDVTASRGVVTAAVCVDADKDLDTLEDREIYLFSSDGNVRQVTKDEIYDSAPRYGKCQGKEALYWYSENGIRLMKESGDASTILARESIGVSENFTVVNGEGQETAIAWSQVDENNVYQLAACLYDAASGKWSKQVMVSDSGKNIFRPSGYFNANGDMEFLYRKGSTIKAGELYALQVAQAPDLEIVNAYIEDGTEKAGQKTKVHVGVRNNGTKKIAGYVLDVDGQETTGSANILPGETGLLEADYLVPDTVEKRELTIKAQVDGDCDTLNNTFVLTTGYADVSVAAVEDESPKGKVVHVAVENTEAVSTNVTLEARKDAADGELLSSKKLGTLKQGDLTTVDFVYQKGDTGYDVDVNALYYVATSSAPEKYESNNYDYSVFKEKRIAGAGDTPPTPPVQDPAVKPGSGSTTKPPATNGNQVQNAAGNKAKASASKVKKPRKVTLKRAKSTKRGALKLTWKRDKKVTGYQAVVARDKKFKKSKKTAWVKKNKTVSKTFTKLKRGKTYFAKVRAYKKIGKKKVYGAYSKVKKVKVR